MSEIRIPRIAVITTTMPVCFASVLLSAQMIYLNSDLRPANQFFFLLFFADSVILSPLVSLNYLVSLCIVCFLQNLQYFLVSILSGWFFFSFVML